MGESPIDDMLVNDNFFMVTAKPEWYAGIVEFLTTQKLPEDWTKEKRKNVRVNSRHFAVVGHRLFRRRTDGLLKRCVSKIEVPTILVACHDIACGGHFFGQLTDQKILRARYFWPTLFKDSHDYMNRCDACQRYARNDLRMEMPLHISLPLVPFEKWRIDYVDEVHPIPPKEWLILLLPPSISPSGRRLMWSKPTRRHMRRHLCMKTSSQGLECLRFW